MSSHLNEQQERDWTRAARAWKKWESLHQACTRPVSEAVLEAAHVAPGLCLLDVACGVGDPALEAARRVAPDGRVVAVDLSAEMVALAREAAAARGIDRVAFTVADGERPPSGPFDAVTCRFGLMFFPDPAAAVLAWRSVARPGARVAVAVWDGPEANPLSVLRPRAVREALGVELPHAGPASTTLASPDALAEVLRRAGLRRVGVRGVELRWEADDVPTLAAMMTELHPPLLSLLEEAGREAAERVLAGMVRALEPYMGAGGRVAVPARSLVGSGLA